MPQADNRGNRIYKGPAAGRLIIETVIKEWKGDREGGRGKGEGGKERRKEGEGRCGEGMVSKGDDGKRGR